MATNTTNTVVSVVAEVAEVPCACRAVLVDGKLPACKRTTKRTFAPGHDAQLKSRLLRAEVAGSSVAWASDPNTPVSVYEVAGQHGFGHQVRDGVVRARRLQQEKDDRKAARDAVREANRATREAAKADAAAKRDEAKAARVAKQAAAKAPKLVAAKVGRWEVQGTVGRDGALSYTTKKGQEKVAKKGSYQLV